MKLLTSFFTNLIYKWSYLQVSPPPFTQDINSYNIIATINIAIINKSNTGGLLFLRSLLIVFIVLQKANLLLSYSYNVLCTHFLLLDMKAHPQVLLDRIL